MIPIRASGDAARVPWGRRVVSVVVSALMVLATLVTGLVTLAPVPATANAAPTPITAYVTNNGSTNMTPIDVGTNTAGTPIPAGTNPKAIAIIPAPQVTTTTLRVTPGSPNPASFQETLTATVAPAAAGSVQFNDGTIPLGGPVPVTGGTASTTTKLPNGPHSLTAVFTPTNPNAFTGSTSPAVSYVVFEG